MDIDSSNEFQIREGPILSQARWDHSCGQFNINDTAFIAVAGGVGAWESLELLDLTNFGNEWMTGRVESVQKKSRLTLAWFICDTKISER